MPELPEVTTTVNGLNKVLKGAIIRDIWTDLAKASVSLPHHKETFKSELFFKEFEKKVAGATVESIERRGKNILIHLSTRETILIHMKMTGHLLYGRYAYDKKTNTWTPHKDEKNDALRDPFNKFIHAVFTIQHPKSETEKHLAFSDMRKFGTISLAATKDIYENRQLVHLGPEPLEKNFTYEKFKTRVLMKPNGKVKQVLMDQSVIAGIGNIYSDEMLWLSDIHPESTPEKIPEKNMKLLYDSMKRVLKQGIDFGGDSTSDYRDITGKPGKFQHHHNVYRRTGRSCGKRGCTGVILRKIVGGRSAHFCDTHQKIFI